MPGRVPGARARRFRPRVRVRGARAGTRGHTRAHAVAGLTVRSNDFVRLAEQAGRDIAEDDDRKILLDDLQTAGHSPDKT